MKPEDFGLKVDDLDERAIRFAKQRKERGWDDSETWSLYTTLAEWLYPRLERFKEVNFCHPCDLTPQEWDGMIQEMAEGFKLIFEDKCPYSEEEQHKMEHALDLFRERFFDLWW